MFTPTDPTPPLTGLGVNVTLPGYEVPTSRPDGARVWLLHDGESFVQHPGGRFEATAPDLDSPVALDPELVVRAAYGLANYIQAALHGARIIARAKAERDAMEEALAAMLAPVAPKVLELMEAA